jgi:hypothetical protein
MTEPHAATDGALAVSLGGLLVTTLGVVAAFLGIWLGGH